MKKYDFSDKTIGFAMTGSFCTYEKIFGAMQDLAQTGAKLLAIFSDRASTTDSRFGNCRDFLKRAEEITGRPPVLTIPAAEPIGPKAMLDLLVIAPCTGNTLAKLANGVSDTPVLMAAKSHLRNNRPVVIFLSTNDALGMNLKNIGILLNTKNIYFVPFGQDNYRSKPNSMIAHVELLQDTIARAFYAQQIQPVILSPHDMIGQLSMSKRQIVTRKEE